MVWNSLHWLYMVRAKTGRREPRIAAGEEKHRGEGLGSLLGWRSMKESIRRVLAD